MTTPIEYVYVPVEVEEWRKSNPIKNDGSHYPMIKDGRVHQVFDFEIDNYAKRDWKILGKVPITELVGGYTEEDVERIIAMVCDQFGAGFVGRNEFIQKVISDYKSKQ